MLESVRAGSGVGPGRLTDNFTQFDLVPTQLIERGEECWFCQSHSTIWDFIPQFPPRAKDP